MVDGNLKSLDDAGGHIYLFLLEAPLKKLFVFQYELIVVGRARGGHPHTDQFVSIRCGAVYPIAFDRPWIETCSSEALYEFVSRLQDEFSWNGRPVVKS